LAWVGVIAIIGLAICAIAELRDYLRSRKERKLPPGTVLTPRPWTRRRIAIYSLSGITIVVLLGILVDRVVGSGGATSTATTLPTVPTSSTTTTTVVPSRPPQQVPLQILNGSGVAKAAATKAASLAALGYPIVGTGNAVLRPGTTVGCKSGLDVEAAALVTALGAGATVVAFPTPAPVGSATAACVVTIGR
jgi:LytR cell envelope-related transcriptional attenuator